MRVAVRVVVIGMCLSCVAFLGACGSKSSGTVSPAPSPSKMLTVKLRAAAYFEALLPVLDADQALDAKVAKFPTLDASNAFSIAALIDSSFLPAIGQIQAGLAAITPPPGFRVAHARLEEGYAVSNDALAFARDTLLRVVHTHTLPPGFTSDGDRYTARIEKLFREYGVAIQAAAKRAGVKVPPRLLLVTKP